jgi:hypothetical protein
LVDSIVLEIYFEQVVYISYLKKVYKIYFFLKCHIFKERYSNIDGENSKGKSIIPAPFFSNTQRAIIILRRGANEFLNDCPVRLAY